MKKEDPIEDSRNLSAADSVSAVNSCRLRMARFSCLATKLTPTIEASNEADVVDDDDRAA